MRAEDELWGAVTEYVTESRLRRRRPAFARCSFDAAQGPINIKRTAESPITAARLQRSPRSSHLPHKSSSHYLQSHLDSANRLPFSLPSPYLSSVEHVLISTRNGRSGFPKLLGLLTNLVYKLFPNIGCRNFPRQT